MWISVLIFILLLLFISIWRHFSRIKLSGPTGLPYFGNVFQLDSAFPIKTLSEWSDRYGGMYRMTRFGSDVVVVSDPGIIKEVLVTKSDHFVDRPKYFRASFLYDGGEIAFGSHSKQWALTKRLSMTGLKLVGTGVERLERIALKILEDLVNEIKNQDGRPFNIRPLLYSALCNINGTLIFGCEFAPEEVPQIVRIDKLAADAISVTRNGMELDLFPPLRFLPNDAFKRLKIMKKEKDQFFGNLVDRAKAAFKENPDEYCCLTELIRYNEQYPGSQTLSIKDTSATMFAGANVTTSESIYPFTGIMAANLDLQKRCQEEIRKVIGSRRPSLNDLSTLPFMESMILELLRYLSHVPMLVPHVSSQDTILLDTSIPKGTEVWINAWHLHHNPALWDEPWEFKPDRFLDEQGQLLPPGCTLRRQLCFFGAGKRVCVGEMLARNRLFLFLTTLLQTFTFYPEEEGAEISYDPRTYENGITNLCKPFKLRAIPNNWSE